MLGTQPSIRHTAVNAIDATGRTQLSHACAKGDYELVKKLLLEPKIDIALEDESGMSPVEYAEKFKHFNCAALVRNEANYRATDPSNVFVTSLRAELAVADSTDFDERLFRQAVQNDPVAAAKYLDRFVTTDRYDYAFTQLDAICGRKDVKSSALYSVLNDSIVDDDGAKHDLLQHVVLQRVLDIKWELFGARKYYQQLLLYILMIGAVLTTVTFDFRLRAAVVASRAIEESDEAERARTLIYSFPVQLTLWLIAVIFAFFAFVHLRHLKPHKFTKLTRWMYDGKYVFDPAFAIPEAAVYKAKAKAWLLRRTILWTVLVATPIVVAYVLERQEGNSMPDLVLATTAFLGYWFLAFYFLHLEVKELLGEDPWLVQRRAKANLLGKVFWSIVIVLYVPVTPFLMSYRKYYASSTNKLQVLTYLCILGPFFWLQLSQILISGVNYGNQEWQFEMYAWVNEAYVCLGAFIILSLWMLSLQYLEVNKTAGYLLPIVKDVMGDVWDFLIFYGVFQCGLTCAYYFIFQQKSDTYKTLWASFRASYFVMYGENGVSDFNAKDEDTKQHLLQGPIMHFGFILRIFHCAVMVVLLLNLLLAMMNKTVDRNWDKLQSRALASYARCVLRLETMLGHTEAAREKRLQILTPAGPVLNSIFDEHISKRQLTTSTAKDTKDDDTQRQGLLTKVHDLTIQNTQLETQIASTTQRLDSQLHDVLTAIQRAAK